ncbi:hypothetical protein H4R20_004243, partial [Coemansia guatemalensis]
MTTIDLTAVALGLVFRHAIGDKINSLDAWKQCLPFLAVNRIWREAALPQLYSSGIIDFANKGIIIIAYNNIELIVSNGGRQFISRLRVCSNHTVALESILGKAKELLSPNPDLQWPSIRAFIIDCPNNGKVSSAVPTPADVTAILKALPNIADIYIDHPHWSYSNATE